MKLHKIALMWVMLPISSFTANSNYINKVDLNQEQVLTCNLEDVLYKERNSETMINDVRFFNQNGNMAEFVRADPIDVHGKMKIEGYKLRVVEGTATGHFTLLRKCTG